jgi:hypothetical protein
MLAGAASAVACGSTTTDSASTGGGAQSSSSSQSSSPSSSSSSSPGAVAGGNGQLTLTGGLTGTVSGNVQCVKLDSGFYNITFAGTTQDVRVTATDDSGGKGVLTSSATGKNYVFGGTGKITVDAKSATFTGAVFSAFGGSGDVTVNGKVSC